MDLGSGRESGDQQHQHHHQPASQETQALPVIPISMLMPSSQLQQQSSNSFHTTPVAPSHHEIPKLKLLNSPSGNGGSMLGQKGDHHVGTNQAREIVRQAVVAVTEAGAAKLSNVKKGTVRYRECHKNHAASIGGHAIDGCGEFMPGGEDGATDSLRCAACDCHRNFHRREVEGEVLCGCKKKRPAAGALSTPHSSPAGGTPMTTTTSTLALPSSQLGQMTPLTMAALSAGGGPTDSDEPDGRPGNSGGMVMCMRSPSAIKKRFRTKFSTEQKDQMSAFADRVGWRIQKHDEAAVQEFCTNAGVKRHVLKVWMHNNKHTMGKKP